MNEFLEQLDNLAQSLSARTDVRPIALLVRRVIVDYEAAIESSLSGFLGAAMDAMRDVLEIEMLLLDFSISPERVAEWSRASRRERLAKYSPAATRSRLRAGGVGRFDDSKEDLDYIAHSEALHVTPTADPLLNRGIVVTDPIFQDLATWEMFQHGRRILAALSQVVEALGDPVPFPRDMPAFREGYERSLIMQEFFFALRELQHKLGRPPTEDEALREFKRRIRDQAQGAD